MCNHQAEFAKKNLHDPKTHLGRKISPCISTMETALDRSPYIQDLRPSGSEISFCW